MWHLPHGYGIVAKPVDLTQEASFLIYLLAATVNASKPGILGLLFLFDAVMRLLSCQYSGEHVQFFFEYQRWLDTRLH